MTAIPSSPRDDALDHIRAMRLRMDTATTVEEMRGHFDWFMTSMEQPEGLQVSHRTFGGVAAEHLCVGTPAPEAPVLFVAHGGGFVMGSPRVYRAYAGAMAKAVGGYAVVPDYRLAPEHPFPAQREDLAASYLGLIASGVSPGRVVFVGDSAGAALVLATLVVLRERCAPAPAGAVAVSGFFDLALGSPSVVDNRDRDPLLTEAALSGMVGAYTQGKDAAAPDVSPVHADLQGLPPLLLQSGELELIRDDSRRLADRATAAGLRASVSEYAGMFHLWPIFWRDLPEAMSALAELANFVDQVTGDQPGTERPAVDMPVAVVTGAAGGIGRACTAELARRGYRVVAADRVLPTGPIPGAHLQWPLDVRDVAGLDALAEGAGRLGPVTAWINAAGVSGSLALFSETTLEEMREVLAINLTGTYLGTRAALQLAERTGTPVSVVNIASVAGLVGSAIGPAYPIAKHGVVGLTRCAAIEAAATASRVNVVCPGPIDTGMFASYRDHPVEGDRTIGDAVLAAVPMGRAGSADDAAEMILWLAGNEASYVTGSVFVLDGGMTANAFGSTAPPVAQQRKETRA